MDRVRQWLRAIGRRAKEADMWALAVQLARSGQYSSWLQIELELRNRGYPGARPLLDNASVRERLDHICAESRKAS
jgi:hypothetical protein